MKVVLLLFVVLLAETWASSSSKKKSGSGPSYDTTTFNFNGIWQPLTKLQKYYLRKAGPKQAKLILKALQNGGISHWTKFRGVPVMGPYYALGAPYDYGINWPFFPKHKAAPMPKPDVQAAPPKMPPPK